MAAHALGCSWSELWSRLAQPLEAATRSRLERLLARRAEGEPLAYLLGTAVFYGLELECGPGVLVPRAETEVLVEVTLELLENRPGPFVVDVGTGTGAIGLAVASQRADARVWATDRSPDALGYARRNAARLGLAVHLVAGDLLSPLGAEAKGTVDALVSNPPYVPAGRTDLLAPDVLAEPAEALYAGPRGDEVMLRLADEAPGCLAPGGVFVCEVGTPVQAATLLERLGTWDAAGVRDDLNGRPRVVWARWK
jgi:release factor glutamine methyltransferase